MGLSTGARLVTLTTLALVVGMVGAGWLGDRIDKRLIIVVAMGLPHVGDAGAGGGDDAVGPLALAAALQGFGWGARGPLTQALRADYFGTASFGKIMGFSAMIIMMGMTAGPLLAGYIYDETGSYTPAFLVLAGASVVGRAVLHLRAAPGPAGSQRRRCALDRAAGGRSGGRGSRRGTLTRGPVLAA